jgi:hypothetical protein
MAEKLKSLKGFAKNRWDDGDRRVSGSTTNSILCRKEI